VEAAQAEGLPLIAGGKSMGGRMTSLAAAAAPLPGVRGLAFLGFPLHAPSTPGTDRAAHLGDVGLPMLFLQGTRDAFAQRDLLEPVLESLGERAAVFWIQDGDHSFRVRKSAGLSEADVIALLADSIRSWASALL
jgi:predicted alpha/beta-hydrolase family hydrolase